MTLTILPSLIERFFTQRLMQQRNVSANTIASYRDTFRLLLRFASKQVGRLPSQLDLADLDAPLIAGFLEHLEVERSIGARSRNLRLTSIRTFFRFVAFEEPAYSLQIQRVLAIPPKRVARREVEFLGRTEIEAILAVPDKMTWAGRRDYTLLLVAVQTGLRLSEITGLNRDAIQLGAGAHIRCVGKGRKERSTPLTKLAREAVKKWLTEPPRHRSTALFPTVHGDRMSADAVQFMLSKYVSVAAETCRSLRAKRVSPHTLRHSAAMELLLAGVDLTVIALWLGHESSQTTLTYLHAHIALKEAALARVTPLEGRKASRFVPDDKLLSFLNAL
ncbi:site-specific integrase (plasmid) [Rhizobium lusitanum]|uniref:tyrosine-type recombinase/integrase n=1 Tax=Rhizobium lusitanum TaxID=293958 RepID=UPI0016102956|nr:tyrosine-type recombinase/integrase [Rhizobium lusitanum]QND44638.1 site-specific integrase [Rhizobium lusitanum]QND44748.1 site-specific integrase [Rhizobium lusitanum]